MSAERFAVVRSSNGMPLVNEHGDVVRVFSAEEYSDLGALANVRPNRDSQEWIGSVNERFQGLEATLYRNALVSHSHGVLCDARTLQRPYRNRPTLQRVVEKHVRGVRDYTFEIEKVLTLMLFLRSLLDGRR